MQRAWIGATALLTIPGPSRGRGRRRILNRYAVVERGEEIALIEVCSPEELLAALPPETATPPEGGAAVEHYVGAYQHVCSAEEITTK